MATPTEPHGISGVGKFLMIYFSLLFGWEIIVPYLLVMAGFPAQDIGDPNTKAVLTNLVIAIMSYIVGRNEGSRQAEQTLAKMADTAKTVATTAASVATAGSPPVDGTVKLQEGQEVKVEAVPNQEEPQ